MLLSPCGINCEACNFDENCKDCFSCEGKPPYLKDFGVDVCPLHDCPVNKKGYKTCGECPDLPCKLFYEWKDPSMSEEEHLAAINERVKALKGE